MERGGATLACLLAILTGLQILGEGEPGFFNFYGQYVGAWVAIGLGVAGLIIILVKAKP